VQAIGWQPNPPIRAPDGVPVHYERHRPGQTTLYRLVQQHAATFFAQTEEATGASLAQFIKDKFDAFLECGILAHGFLRLRCDDCGHDKLVAFSCKRRGFARRAGPGAWPRRRPTWSITSFRACQCASGFCRCLSRCACYWPRNPSW